VRYADALSIATRLANLYDETPGPSFVADPRTNQMLVQAPTNVQSITAAVVAQLDVPPEDVGNAPRRILNREAPFRRP
jgi:hypothetical protein